MSGDAADNEILQASFERTGAVVMGRRTFDFIDGPNGWSDDIGYGYDQEQAGRPPCFVVTHRAPERTRLRGFEFVTDGLPAAHLYYRVSR